MIFISILLLIAIIIFIYIYLRVHFSYWARHDILEEKPVLIIGNMKGLGQIYHFKDINQQIYERFKNLTKFVGIYVFFQRVLLITDLNLIKQILVKDFNAFMDRGLFHNVRDDPLTGNLLFMDGKAWHVLRHKLTSVFSIAKLKTMYPIISDVGERLAQTCNKILTESNEELELKDLCARYTIDIIGNCGFGIECNSLADPESEFRQMGKDVFERPRHNIYIQTFMFNNPELARKLRMKVFKEKTHIFFMDVVRKTVEHRVNSGEKRNDFMDLMIELKLERDALHGRNIDENDLTNGLSFEQVAAQAMMFFLAGFETSSTTMANALYELAENPIVQEKLHQEIVKVIEANNNEVTYDMIKNIPYLDMVIAETLRKHPILPHLVRRSTAPYKLPNTKLTLKTNSRIFIPIHAIHYDEDIYPDAEKFIPERFMPEAIAQRHSFSYLPFGDGPRNCIGLHFGKMQIRIGLVALLRQFRFSTTVKTQKPLRYSLKHFLLFPADGIYLKVDKRFE